MKKLNDKLPTDQKIMKAYRQTLSALLITDAPGLDRIAAILNNTAPGKGTLIVTCRDQAWTCSWGNMGSNLQAFIGNAPAETIAIALTRGLTGRVNQADLHYITAICEAIKSALKMRAGRYVQPGSRPTPTQDKVLELLEEHGPMSDATLAIRMGTSECGARVPRKALYEGGYVHIADWRRTKASGPWERMWGVGSGPDAERPTRIPAADRCKTYRLRQKVRQHATGPASIMAMLGA